MFVDKMVESNRAIDLEDAGKRKVSNTAGFIVFVWDSCHETSRWNNH